MRTLLVLAALGLSPAAMAATFPISGVYGTSIGCADYANLDAQGNVEDILYVTPNPNAIVGFEQRCVPTAVNGTVLCGGEDGLESQYVPIDLSLNADDDTLLYKDAYRTVTLHRCPEPTAM
jgi:hypothetical protein